MTEAAQTRSPRRKRRIAWAPILALAPAAVVAVVVYIGAMLWTVRLSFTNSRMLPLLDYAGLAQYRRLFATERFTISAVNIVIFGVLFIVGALMLGFLLAVFIDQKVRAEGIFRTIFLYPYSMSFIVTGLAWQWFLNPQLGIQNTVRGFGFPNFTFDWIVNQDRVIYTLVIAAIWQASGLPHGEPSESAVQSPTSAET